MSRPLIRILLHCLLRRKSKVSLYRSWSSASFTDIRADELWTHFDGMIFCGDYKDRNMDRETSTELSHNNYFVAQRLPGRAPVALQTPRFPNSPTTPLPVNPPFPPDPLASLRNQTKRPRSKHQGSTGGSGICISHSCS